MGVSHLPVLKTECTDSVWQSMCLIYIHAYLTVPGFPRILLAMAACVILYITYAMLVH